MISVLSRRRLHSPIGLDLGATGARAVQLTRSHDMWTLDRAAGCERFRTDNPPTIDDPKREQEIVSCLRQADFRERRVVVGLGSPEVEFVSLELPEAVVGGGAQAGDVVRWEVQRLINAQEGTMETAYWTLPNSPATNLNAIGVAAPTETLTKLLAMCHDAGTECVCTDASATALARFGSLLHPWDDHCIWGLLDVGHRQARLVLCRGSTPVLARVAGPAGDVWTGRIADTLKISRQSAEIHKCEYGIARRTVATDASREPNIGEAETSKRAHDTTSDSDDAGGVGTVIMGILRKDFADLVAELKRSYEYVLSCYPSCQAADLILVGGGSRLRNLPALLAEELHTSVRPAGDYLSSTACRLRCPTRMREPLECFALSIGLAMET